MNFPLFVLFLESSQNSARNSFSFFCPILCRIFNMRCILTEKQSMQARLINKKPFYVIVSGEIKTLIGTISVNTRGVGYVRIPKQKRQRHGVSHEDLATALHGTPFL